MTKQYKYQQLKASFSAYGSWALWNVDNQVQHQLPIHHQDLDIAHIRHQLDTQPAYLEHNICFDAIFVGLNWATSGNASNQPWETFHDHTHSKNTAGKAARILLPSKFRGCYMTDLVKNHCETDGTNVVSALKKPVKCDILKQNIDIFMTELRIVNPKLLILSGRQVADLYRFAVDTFHLTNMPRTIQIPHYSSSLSYQDCNNLAQLLNKQVV